jgi:hypothetical protein
MESVLNQGELRLEAAAAVSAGTDVNSSIVACRGQRVVFFCTIATANAGNYIKVQQNATNTTVGMADLADSKVVALANGNVVAVEINKPVEGFLRAVVVRGGTNTAVGDIYCYQCGLPVEPADNIVTDEIDAEVLNSPAEGTA